MELHNLHHLVDFAAQTYITKISQLKFLRVGTNQPKPKSPYLDLNLRILLLPVSKRFII